MFLPTCVLFGHIIKYGLNLWESVEIRDTVGFRFQ